MYIFTHEKYFFNIYSKCKLKYLSLHESKCVKTDTKTTHFTYNQMIAVRPDNRK